MREILYESWTTFAEETLREILPHDFPATANVYIVPQRQLTHDLWRNTSVAWTHPALDLLLEDHLTETRCWRGRGFCCVANGDILDRIEDEMQAPGFLWKTAATVTHEALHYILDASETPALANAASRDDLPADLRSVYDIKFAPQGDESNTAMAIVQKLFHGPPFQRLAEHAIHRIERAGRKCTPAWLGLGESDAPPGGFRAVREALADELQRCESWPLRLIAATTPPDEFTDLFTR